MVWQKWRWRHVLHHDPSSRPTGTPARSMTDRPEFRALIQAKRRSSRPALVIGLGTYLVVSLLAGYAPSLMSERVLGSVNLGFVLILVTYVLTWTIAVLYVRRANRTFDRMADQAAVSANLPSAASGRSAPAPEAGSEGLAGE